MRVGLQPGAGVRPHSVHKAQDERRSGEEADREGDVPFPSPKSPCANAKVCLRDRGDDREQQVRGVEIGLTLARSPAPIPASTHGIAGEQVSERRCRCYRPQVDYHDYKGRTGVNGADTGTHMFNKATAASIA